MEEVTLEESMNVPREGQEMGGGEQKVLRWAEDPQIGGQSPTTCLVSSALAVFQRKDSLSDEGAPNQRPTEFLGFNFSLNPKLSED